MTPILHTDVLIVGAGPVGSTVAMILRRRGVDVTLVERRAIDEPSNARCNTVASRTMEIWRRLGLADKVRASGLTDDYPGDVVWATRLNGHEIARLPLASRKTRYVDMAVADAPWPTPEPVHRASQHAFDHVLREHAEKVIGVRMRYECSLLDFEQDAEGVTATLVSGDGEPLTIRSKLLIGCDGGRSVVRKQLGIPFQGDTEIFRARSRLIRAPWMREHIKGRPGWMNWYLGPGPMVNLIAIDGQDLWLVHAILPYGQTDFEALDYDAAIREGLSLRPDHSYETLSREDWTARRFIAERFRDRRVFICGDAAHIWVPFAGYGMNAGVADGENLANCVAAYLEGWAGEGILDCYEAERHPVAEQVSRYAMDKAMEYVNGSIRNSAPAVLDDDGEEGRRVRHELGRKLLEVNVEQFACAGLNFGYYYDQSPVIAYDREPHPSYGMGSYTPSTVPGCRMPHFWLPDGTSLYDIMGPVYTLVRFDPTVDIGSIVDAAKLRGVPLEVVDVDNPDPMLFREALVLVRPDRHVAWRGAVSPVDAVSLIDLVRQHQGVAKQGESRAA